MTGVGGRKSATFSHFKIKDFLFLKSSNDKTVRYRLRGAEVEAIVMYYMKLETLEAKKKMFFPLSYSVYEVDTQRSFEQVLKSAPLLQHLHV